MTTVFTANDGNEYLVEMVDCGGIDVYHAQAWTLNAWTRKRSEMILDRFTDSKREAITLCLDMMKTDLETDLE